jgi:hypothetical protein
MNDAKKPDMNSTTGCYTIVLYTTLTSNSESLSLVLKTNLIENYNHITANNL